MSVLVRDICNALEVWAPEGAAYEWDRAGLSVGSMGSPVSGVLVCLTVTHEAFAKAKRAGAEMIVSHHPLIWEPLRVLRTDNPHTRLCLDIAKANIAVFSAHTNLDVVPGGVSHLLAARLGLRGVRPLFPVDHARMLKLVTFVPESHLRQVRDAVSEAGAGVIGEYTHCSFSTPGTGSFLPSAQATPFSGEKGQVNEEPEIRFETLVPEAKLNTVMAALRGAHPYEEIAFDLVTLKNIDTCAGLGVCGEIEKAATLADFARHVRKRLEVSHVRMIGKASRKVKRIAVLGGAGGGSIAHLPEGIDVFVTGDVKYHDACDAIERGVGVIDAGHAGTEWFIVPAMADYLKSRFGTLRIHAYREPALFHIL